MLGEPSLFREATTQLDGHVFVRLKGVKVSGCEANRVQRRWPDTKKRSIGTRQ